MFKKRLLGCLTLAAFLFSGASLAQDDDEFLLGDEEIVEPKPVYTSTIELGIGWQSQDSFKFGEFNGLTDRGAFVIGNLRISRRDAWDSGGTTYWTLTGTNLGLSSRNIGFEYGKQGSFKIFASFDQTPKYLLDDARTPYILNATGTNLTLPAGWVASDREVSQLTQLNASLNPVNIKHDRQKFGGGFTWNIDKHWTFTTKFTHETKEGTRTVAAIFGENGGDPAGAIIPEPIDYVTNNFDIILQYSGDRAMFSLSYNLSKFDDKNTSLVFQNMFASSSWDVNAGFPGGFGQMALPPDNKASRITLSGGYLFSPKTRATVNVMYSHATQNDPFLPYTVNPLLATPIPLPASSLMGEIDTLMVQLGLSSRLSSRLTLNVQFRFEDRDNNTPQNVYIKAANDSRGQGTLNSSLARINLPYDREQLRFKADLGYRLSSKVRLAILYTYEQLERTFAEVAKTKEHLFEGKVRFTPSTKTFGWLGISFADRNGTGYIDNFLFLASHTPEFLGPNPEDEFENHPLIRKFFIADREQLKFSGAFNWLPSNEVTIGLFGSFINNEYNNTVLGLTENTTASGTFDVAFMPSEVITYHAYVTYESLEYDQAGVSHRPFPPLNDLFNLATQGWTANTHDKVVTFGFGFDWQAIKDKLKFVADFTYSNANTEHFLTGGTTVTFLQLPDLKSKLVAVEAKMDYQYRPNITIRASYWFQDLEVTDWALDGVDPDTMRRIVGLGNQSPSYNVHILGFSTIFDF